MSESLAEAFPKEQARIRELISEYESIGLAGAFGAAMLKGIIVRADAAAASGDTVEMIRVYAEMEKCE